MFSRLLESSRHRERRVREVVLSIVLHGALLTAAVVASADAGPNGEMEVNADTLYFQPSVPVDPDVIEASAPDERRPTATPAAPQTPVEIPPFLDVPTGLPPIDSASVIGTALEDIARAAQPSDGLGSTAPKRGTNDVLFEHQVDRPARAAPDNPSPVYPSTLRRAGVEGRVVVQFVVDTTGGIEAGSVRILSATHPLFETAVRAVLARSRYIPAEISVGSRRQRVRQLVQQSFGFDIR